MQKISSYLYSNKVDINLDLASSPTEWRIVYQRKVKIYKGYDNVIELDIKNSQQKRFDVSALNMKCLVMDSLGQEIYIADVTHTATPITISSFTSKLGAGPFLVTFAIPTQNTAPIVGNAYIISGNSNGLYNGTYIATASSTTSITLSYASNPGTYGTGVTSIASKLSTGIATFTIPAADVDYLSPQFLRYAVYVLNEDETKNVIYGDTQFGVTGMMDLIGSAVVTAAPVQVIKTFTYLHSTSSPVKTYYSESVEINPRNDISSTADIDVEFKNLGLAATVNVQITYDKVVHTATNWETIDTFTLAAVTASLTNTYSIPTDFTNEVNWLRITYVQDTENTGKFDRVNVIV